MDTGAVGIVFLAPAALLTQAANVLTKARADIHPFVETRLSTFDLQTISHKLLDLAGTKSIGRDVTDRRQENVMRVGFTAVACVMLASAGCVSMGPNYSTEALAQLKPGMAKVDVIAVLGKPTSTVTLPDGRQQLMWIHSRGTMLGTADARAAMLMFSPTGAYLGTLTQSETNLR